MSQTKYVMEVSEFYEILLDDKLDNKNFQFINDDMVQMIYNFKDQFVDNSKNTNVYIACFTTSHARLMLYNKLDYLKEKVLYTILAWQARPGTTHDGSGTEGETYSSISATNQHQLRQKIYQSNLQSFFV